MKLLYATKNTSKIYNMKNRLKDLAIDLLTPYDLDINIAINENGQTAKENAIKKAEAYFLKTNLPTIAADTGLFISKLPKDKQPGLFVKRINAKEENDEETLIQHYQNLLNSVGGNSDGYYITGVAYIDETGVYSIEIKEDPFIVTAKRNTTASHRGNFLDLMTIDPIVNKYYCELSDQELLQVGITFETEMIKFIKRYVLKQFV